jgi:hypothetical protein
MAGRIPVFLGILALAAVARAEDPPKRDLERENAELKKRIAELEKKLGDPAPVASPTPAAGTVTDEIFPVRLGHTLLEDLSSPAYSPPGPSAPPPQRRRAEPAPFDSPPYPVAEWQINGTPTIGDANLGTPYPSVIMDTLYNGPNGDWWRENRFAIYGWFDWGGNISSSRNLNLPTGYIIRANKVEIDQVALYLERRPDENQTDHFDWGFRVTGLYGLDYRFMISRGIFDGQLHNEHQQPTPQNPGGEIWGFDIPMCYADFYLPWFLEGVNIRLGRFISVPDIEAQLAADNFMYTHSLMYTYDIYTQCGAIATVKIDANWAIQVGCVSGNDVAPWEHRRFTQPNSGPSSPFRVTNRGVQATAIAMVQWISPEWALGRDSIYVGVNGINDGHFGYNNIQELPIGTWTHKFNEYFSMWTEAYYMYERDNPTLGAYTWEAGVVNYFVVRLAANTLLTIRNEYFDDARGARTGFKTPYSEHTVGITHWFNKLMTFRPEFGYWHSYREKAFDNGTKGDQFLVAADLIIHY